MSRLYFWPDMPVLSVTVLVAISMLFLYLARTPLHLALESINDGLAGGLKRTSEWFKSIVLKLQEKNRKILLETSMAETEQKIANEFKRMEASYAKHLAQYPALHLKLDESIANINADFKECGQVVPVAPGWSAAAESIARIQGIPSGDRVIEKMLKELHKSAVEGEKMALAEMRKTASQRHKILSGLAPIWNKILKTMNVVESKVSLVLETAGKMDKYMRQYDDIKHGGKESIDMLSSKATKLFIFSMIVMMVAGFGAFINFNLIALPMSEMVPAGSRVLGLQVSDVAALVIITLEIVLGIFLMEALLISSIFPQIAGMTTGKRRIILFASLLGLFFLASVEAALAVLREHIAETNAATAQALAGKAMEAISGGNSKITVIGQAVLGFVLPWILAMVAIPLEMLIESGQHVLGKVLILLINMLGYLIGALGYLFGIVMKAVVHIYDAYIIIPVQIGNLIKGNSHGSNRVQKGSLS